MRAAGVSRESLTSLQIEPYVRGSIVHADHVVWSPMHRVSQSPVRAGSCAGHPPSARLAAWTVARQANAGITVTVRQLSDPSGLPPALPALPPDPGSLHSVYHADKTTAFGDTVLVIRPPPCPPARARRSRPPPASMRQGHGSRRASVNQAIRHAAHQPAHQAGARNAVLRAGLVYASQQCTGS